MCCPDGSRRKSGSTSAPIVFTTAEIVGVSRKLEPNDSPLKEPPIGENRIPVGSADYEGPILFVQTADDFCGQCPEYWERESPYQGDPRFTLYDANWRNRVRQAWGHRCECRPAPPKPPQVPVLDLPPGGQCSCVQYVVTYRQFLNNPVPTVQSFLTFGPVRPDVRLDSFGRLDWGVWFGDSPTCASGWRSLLLGVPDPNTRIEFVSIQRFDGQIDLCGNLQDRLPSPIPLTFVRGFPPALSPPVFPRVPRVPVPFPELPRFPFPVPRKPVFPVPKPRNPPVLIPPPLPVPPPPCRCPSVEPNPPVVVNPPPVIEIVQCDNELMFQEVSIFVPGCNLNSSNNTVERRFLVPSDKEGNTMQAVLQAQFDLIGELYRGRELYCEESFFSIGSYDVGPSSSVVITPVLPLECKFVVISCSPDDPDGRLRYFIPSVDANIAEVNLGHVLFMSNTATIPPRIELTTLNSRIRVPSTPSGLSVRISTRFTGMLNVFGVNV